MNSKCEMANFGQYAAYYDLLYADKDYAAETEFVANVLAREAPLAVRVLDMGCGTGVHADLLTRSGYSVHGIDRSPGMIEIAQARLLAQGERVGCPPLSFGVADVRTYRGAETFDAVISLFHVLSYQTSNDDLMAMLQTAAHHLRPDGILLCDFWYGPAVLSEQPSVRVKRCEGADIAITRIAEPRLNVRDSVCDISYTLYLEDTKAATISRITELHSMRYIFLPELDLMARASGLSLKSSFEWLSGDTPGGKSWSVCAVLQK